MRAYIRDPLFLKWALEVNIHLKLKGLSELMTVKCKDLQIMASDPSSN